MTRKDQKRQSNGVLSGISTRIVSISSASSANLKITRGNGNFLTFFRNIVLGENCTL